MSNESGIRFRILRILATTVYNLAWPIVLLSVIAAAASIYYAATHLKFSGNPNDLLRSDATFHQRYLQYTHEFRAEEDYVVVVAGNEFDRNREAVEWIAGELLKQPDLFKKVFYKMDLSKLTERGLLFLEVPQLKEIETNIGDFIKMMGKDKFNLDLNSLLEVAAIKFDPKYMRQEENQAGLDTFAEEFAQSLNALADRLEGKTSLKPARFGDFMAKNAAAGDMEKQQALHEYLSLDDGRILLIQIPSPSEEASFGDHQYVIKPIKDIIEAARKKFPGLEIGLTGEPALSEDQSIATQRDSTQSSIITFILIALLFWVAFREFSRPALALATLVIAVSWTLGFATLTVGRINMLSMAFIPMILGLGIDFGIQILGRYEEELPKAGNVINALTQTLMHAGNAILTGASTTAAAFYTMCLNQFTGLAEMGVIGGSGILLCLFANLVLFPALLAIRDRRSSSAQKVPSSQSYDSTKISFFDRMVLERPWAILLLAVLLTIGGGFLAPKVWFDYNLLHLQNEGLESVRYERKLLDSERSVLSAVCITENLAEAETKAEKFKKLPSVREVISITEIVPRDQDEKLKIITRIKSKLEKVKLPKSGVKVNVPENIRVLTMLRGNAERMQKLALTWGNQQQKKEAQEFFGRLIPPMARALKVLGSIDNEKAEQILTLHQTQLFGELRKNLDWLRNQKVDGPFTEKDVPQSLRDRYVGKSGKILIEIFPKGDIWDREPLKDFVEQLRTVDPLITGTPVQNYEYIELLKTSYQEAGLWALAAVVVLISLHFRTLKYIVPTLLPLGLAIVWTLGIMVLAGLPFNPANIITLPLIIGIGVAFGVYTVDRYRENLSPAIFSTSTGKAILLSALTTIFGFGSLVFASDPSFRSLGLVMTIGVTMCLITSLYVCPAILQLLGRRKIKVE